MTSCPASSTLRTFADLLLDDAETERVERHLDECEVCRAEVERLERQPDEPLQQRLRKVAVLNEIDNELTVEKVPDHIGQYKILGRIGQGGMETVFQAIHPHLEREVAIKVVKESRALDPAVKVLDLGLATLRHDEEIPAQLLAKDSDTTTTKTGHILGSPDYLSPEQALGLEVDQQSDIYSLVQS